MNEQLRSAKRTIRTFMREQYSDADLVRALDFARAGHLNFMSCCCFAGVPTRGAGELHVTPAFIPGTRDWVHGHLDLGHRGIAASTAYCILDFHRSVPRRDGDDIRRRRIIPMFLAEIRRRKAVPRVAEPVAQLVLAQ